jgi:hypothetical protein
MIFGILAIIVIAAVFSEIGTIDSSGEEIVLNPGGAAMVIIGILFIVFYFLYSPLFLV